MRKALLVMLAVVLCASLVMGAEKGEEKAQADSTKTKMKAENQEKKLELIETGSGLKYADLVVGEGKEAVNGMNVECHYTLWFADEKGEKGERFQSSKDLGKPFSFKLGSPGLIKGWNEGMVGMKEGGTRLLVIPPELGYGQGGRGIPPNQTLIFEIDFLRAL